MGNKVLQYLIHVSLKFQREGHKTFNKLLPSEQTVRVAATWSTDTHGAPIHMDVIPRIVGGTGILQRTGNRCRNTPVMLCNGAVPYTSNSHTSIMNRGPNVYGLEDFMLLRG